MKTNFDSTLSFYQYFTHCPFCHSKLRGTITNYLEKLGFKSLTHQIKNLEFSFNLPTELFPVILTEVTFNITDNTIRFPDNIDPHLAINSLIQLSPYIEKYCPNKKCKTYYSVNTTPLSFDTTQYPFIISPVQVLSQNFHVLNWFISNNWSNQQLIIFFKENKSPPITLHNFNLDNFDQQYIVNKINSLILFL